MKPSGVKLTLVPASLRLVTGQGHYVDEQYMCLNTSFCII